MRKEFQDVIDRTGDLGPHLLVLLKVVLIVLAAFVVERIIVSLLRSAYAQAKAQGHDEVTRYRFARNAVRSIVAITALGFVAYVIPSVRSLAVTLFAGAGILAALIGFSAQKAFSNIISGFFIVAFKPFRVGDNILIGQGATGPGLPERSGIVEDITLRHTVILTFENRRIIIPNAIISDEFIVNSTIRDPATCEYVEVPIALTADVRKAMALLAEICLGHKDQIDRRTAGELEAGDSRIPVRLVRLSDSALVLRAYVWAKDPITARMMHYDLNVDIVERFRAEGIEIPVPTRKLIGPIPQPA
ncbi:MAG: mechanosensitive ion channel [Flavobacteriales bacterium]